MKIENLQDISIKEILHSLKTSSAGITEVEAEKRMNKHGKNILPEKNKFTSLDIAIRQVKSPLVYILLIAALISFALGELVDAGVILFAVFLNTIVGFIQEIKAENSLEKLKKMIEHRSRVIRDGIEKEIDSRNIVPGDVILLRAGDRVPADGRMLEVHELEIDESNLTGESIPVNKILDNNNRNDDYEYVDNVAYMGTSIIKGRGQMVVVATGSKTKFGQIALLLKETEDEDTPLQLQLAEFVRFFGFLTFVIVAVILAIGLFEGIPFVEIFTLSVAIAVAAIPEGLLVAVTVVLALGMQRILKNGSLVRKLIAAETLGSTTVICTDKTGTMTKGEMEVDHIITLGSTFSFMGGSKERIIEEEKHEMDHMVAIKIGIICNNAIVENLNEELENWRIRGDYTEKALLYSGLSAGFDPRKLKQDYVRLEEIPFNSERKFMATLNRSDRNDYEIYVKGSPEEIISRSRFILENGKKRKMSEDDLRFFKKSQNDLSKDGLRVLGVAFKSVGEDVLENFTEEGDDDQVNNLIFVGLIAIKDPIRPEAKRTIELAKQAGVKVIMITGDNHITAKTIANELGMKVEDSNILDGYQLDHMSKKDFNNIVSKIKVYARVSPHHKSRIVDALQMKGEVVAMTGDGVNDAPALKSADIGIALGSGTEVAKGASDIVLLDNNLKTIITAIEEGRVIYENIRKVILYLVSDSFSEVILVAGSLIIGIVYQLDGHLIPLTAAQILWINLITDGLPNAALTMEPKGENIMKELPRRKNEPLLNLEMKILIAAISISSGLISLLVFWYLYDLTGDFLKASTVVFAILSIDSLIYVFSIRSLRNSIFQKNIFSNKYLIAAVVIAFIFQLVAIYHPFFQDILNTVSLDVNDWSLILFVFVIEIVIIETVKYLFLNQKNK